MAEPKTLGRYEIQSELGRGTLGVVYLAYDPQFKHIVAVKVLPRELSLYPGFLSHFEAESKTVISLEHASIVSVYDAGVQDGWPYLAMRHMPGGTLAERLNRGALSLDLVSRIVARVAAALDEAHRKNVVHRDIQPANILFDQREDAFVADFGVIGMIEHAAYLTGSGIVGSPTYIAPEMAAANGVTPLVDIYALGVTLFQMVTGRLPYDADTPIGMLMAHSSLPIPDVCQITPGLPQAVQNVIERAMAKKPEERYQSAGSLAADLLTSVSQASNRQLPVAGVEMAPGSTQRSAEMGHSPNDHVILSDGTSDAAASRQGLPASRPGTLLGIGAVALSLVIVLAAAITQLAGVPTLLRASNSFVFEMGLEVTQTLAIVPKATDGPTVTPDPTMTPILVAHNADWQPVIQEFDGVEMVQVPAGCFLMGDDSVGAPEERPISRQCLYQPFWIDRYEVSNAQFGSPGNVRGDDNPREMVTWNQARAHCESRGARLPTEVEWEYAARGPDGLTYPWGDTFDGSIANVCDVNCGSKWSLPDKNINDGFAYTAPVGSFPGGASWVGALDMSGNVSELTSTIFTIYPYNATDGREATSPDALLQRRSGRGGSWISNAYLVRAAYRADFDPDTPYDFVGFRCARDY